MALFFFFNQRKPRRFNYQPLHYDPVQEEREQRRRELLGPDAVSPLDKNPGQKEYKPGMYLKEGMGVRRGSMSGAPKKSPAGKQRSTVFMLALLLLLILLAVLMYR